MSDTTNQGGVATQPKRSHHAPLSKVTSIQEAFAHPDFKARIAEGLPRHMSGDRMLRVCTLSVQRQPKLMQCTPISLIGAFLTCSQLGLEPNTPLGHVYLIPFEVTKWNAQKREREYVRTDVQVIIGYPGLIDLSYRTGLVSSIHADVVWAGDDWSFSYGTDAHVRHRPMGKPRPDDAVPEWAYAHASLKDGQAFEVMPYREVLRIRNGTQAYRTALAALEKANEKGWKPPATYTEAPWVKHEIAMARKTVFRQLSKWLPRSVELSSAIQLDEQQDRGTINWSEVVTDNASVIDGGLALTDDSQDDGGGMDPTFGLRNRVVDGETGEVVQTGGGQQQDQQRQPSQQREAPRETQKQQEPRQTRPPRQQGTQQRTAAPPPADDGPPPGHPAWGGDDNGPSEGDDAPTQGTANPPTDNQAHSEAAAEDEFVLIDEHGEPVGEPDANPVAFARRFADYLAASKNPPAVIENNRDACDFAAMASTEARHIIADAEEATAKPADDKPAAGTDQRWVVQMPLNGQGKPNTGGYMANLKTVLGSVTNAGDMEAFIAANGDFIASLPPVARSTAQTAISDRRASLGLSTVTGQPVQQQAPTPGPNTDDAKAAGDDRDTAWADAVIANEIGKARTLNELHAATGNAAIKTRFARLQKERPDLHERIGVAYRAKEQALKGGN